jgi:hypothetical protein
MEIRQSLDTDEGGIRELFYTCFGRHIPHTEWSWKYKGSPWGSSAVVTVDDGKIIAHYGGLRMRFYSPKRIFEVYQPCDVMTHPKYRARIFSKRGAMVKAGELFYRDNFMDFAFGFPSERHAILGTRQLGYTEHNYITVLTKKVTRNHKWNPLLKIETEWNRVDDEELDDLWEKTRDTYNLSIDKDSSYIFWRYRDNPVKEYRPFIVRSKYKKKLKAFSIFSANESELYILDLFVSRGIKPAMLFQLFEKKANEYGLKNIKVWINPEEDIYRTLTNNDYVQEKGVPYIFKIINKEITPLFLFKNYCYRMGDYDAS